MPDPLRGFYQKSGMWPKCEIPTPAAVRALEHLMRNGPPEPRLFTGLRGGRTYVELSNAVDAVGFSTKIDVCVLVWEKLLVRDPEWEPRLATGIKAYKISNKGREAVAQFYARERYLNENVDLAKRILAECRKVINAR